MKNREPERPGRVKLTFDDGTTQYAVIERADEPSEVGTPLNKKLLDYAVAACGVTAGTATAYTLNDEFGGFTLVDGAKVNFRLHTASGSNPTLNVAGTGARAIKTPLGLPLRQGIAAGMWLTAMYSAPQNAYIVSSAPAPVYEVISRTVIPAWSGGGGGDYPVFATIQLPPGYSEYRLTGMTDTGAIGGRIEVSNQTEAFTNNFINDRDYDYVFLLPTVCYLDFAISGMYMRGTMITGGIAVAGAKSSAAITSVIFRAEYTASESVITLEGLKI